MSKFRKFYERHRKRIFAYLLKITGDYYLSSDIVQESFTRYFEKYGERQTNPSLLNVITRNVLIDKHRRMDHYPRSFDEHEHSAGNPEKDLMTRDTCRRVLAAMNRLEKPERDILMLAAGSRLSYREIARLIGTSEGNVKIMVHRARIKLKKLAGESEG